MIELIDFTNCKESEEAYGGKSGNKRPIIYNNEKYMLKFPPENKRSKEESYSFSCISEYIGCKIFSSVGIKTQDVILGKFYINDKEKIVVACKDFRNNTSELQEFGAIKNKVITSDENGYGTSLENIEYAILNQNSINSKELLEWFYDMFIIDSLIGNFDRHNGNWGFLYDKATNTKTIAPIYDCGSSLYANADEKIIKACLEKQEERDFRVYKIPSSQITYKGYKIRYFEFISSIENAECNKALLKMYNKINLKTIYSIIDEIPCITDERKTFYKTMLKERKEKILDFSLNKLINNNLDLKKQFEKCICRD